MAEPGPEPELALELAPELVPGPEPELEPVPGPELVLVQVQHRQLTMAMQLGQTQANQKVLSFSFISPSS